MHARFTSGFAVFLIPLFILVIAASANADPPSITPDGRICEAQAGSYLEARLGLWQQRMNLADWKISLLLSRASDLKPKTLGNIHWDTRKKTAIIRVLDPSDYRLGCRDALSDMEMTLVHELVHLELSSLPRPQTSRHEEELAVNRIADALLRLDRQSGARAATLSEQNIKAVPESGSGDRASGSR